MDKTLHSDSIDWPDFNARKEIREDETKENPDSCPFFWPEEEDDKDDK